jgi:hypothetical protein
MKIEVNGKLQKGVGAKGYYPIHHFTDLLQAVQVMLLNMPAIPSAR